MESVSLATACAPGKRACILGLGRSGLAVARLLLSRGLRVRALERSLKDEARAAWAPLAAAGAELTEGPHPLGALEGCALLVRSPGVPADVPILLEARRRGLPVRSELAIAAHLTRAPMLAITGTNGKSTTTAWTAHLLQHAGMRATAAGNIGLPLSQVVLEAATETILVVEVSSFQLEDSPEFHPRAAAILNITPDHLDRHGSFAAYAEAKWSITARQGAADLLVLGPDLQPPAEMPIAARMVRCVDSDCTAGDAFFVRAGVMTRRWGAREQPLMPARELALPGPHNLINAMTAAALAATQVADVRQLIRGLRDFGGLAHRLEEVGCVGDVRVVNDSKSTNVDSLRVALRSYAEPVVLIAGGRDKEGPFADLAADAARRVRHLVAIGEAAAKIRAAWPRVPSETAPDLDTALTRAIAAAGAGGLVLLSPGCASFDMFRDFEERGDRFRALVRKRAGYRAPVSTETA